MTGYPNDQSNPAGAIPVRVVPGGATGNGTVAVDKSVTLNAGVAAAVCAANPLRNYLFIQPIGRPVWVSFVGVAAPSAKGSFEITLGETYECLVGVPGNAVSVYCSDTINCTVYEG